jgi:long-chain acyl-CoA synthetase
MTNITRLFDFPYYQLSKINKTDCFVTKYNGKWVKTSSQKYIDDANAVSRVLLEMGIKKHDKIGLITSTNRTEWNILDIGILQTGAQTVPIYPTITAEEYEYILNHSECKYCFISDQVVFDKIKSIKQNVPSLIEIYSFDEIENCKNWINIVEKGYTLNNHEAVETSKSNVVPEDLATIIYTSGTTGKPKGVMLSHRNIVSNVLDSSPRIPLNDLNSVALSFLPICHIFERVILYIYQYNLISIYFAESIEKMTENLKEVHPHVMTVVPRLLEKVYDRIVGKGNELSGIKKRLFFWALELGHNYKPYQENGAWYEFKLKIAKKLVFSKWQEALGGNIKILVSGSAALQPRLARVFAAAGMPVMEGYGLTETSPVITVNDMRNHLFRVGTVGKPIQNVTVKIAEDGEVLCKGNNVMMGYYKQEDLTNEVIKNGYFHTGDIGEIDKDGFLKITDRKKEMFKTSGGKYISPAYLETNLKQSLFIEQVMVIGDGEKMPAAIIQPSFDFLKDYVDRKNIECNKSLEDLCKNENILKRIQKEIDTINEKFGNWEKIKKFELTPEIWSIEGGHLTPTLKLKRKIVREKYQELYNKIYSK